MNGKLTILVCILVAGVIVGASLPIFDSLTASSDSIHNEGAGWVRFDLNKSADASYNINVSWDENGYYIANGSNVQTFDDSTVTNFETIIYADSNVSVWTFDGEYIYMLGTDAGAPVKATFTDPVSIARDSTGVVISDGTDSYTFGAPAWAYVPQSSGAYGFFNYDEERGVKNPTGTPTAVIGGGNVGVYAYNDIYTYDGLGLTMHPIIDAETGLYYGAEWYRDIAPLDPDAITINPLDPSVINPGDSTQPVTPIDDPGIDIIDPFDPGAVVMAVPTPTYTSGDWGYDLSTIDGVQQATIVSYSGSGGNIVIPATIDNYPVHTIGKGGASQYIMDNSSITAGSTITISEGIKKININAFRSLTNLSGTLVIPSSIVELGNYCFEGCTGLTGTLVIPNSVNTMGIWTFRGTGFSKVIIENNITEIPQSSFSNCSNLTEYVIPDTVNTYGGSCFSYCSALTDIKLDSITNVGGSAFTDCTNIEHDLIIPTSVNTIGASAFQNITKTKDVIVIPNTVTSLGNSAFGSCRTNRLIIATDATPGSNCFSGIKADVLDLSDTVDYSVNRYGINYQSTFYDSIGDCFGYIAVADLEGGGNGTIGDLIALLPVIMLAGIVLFSIVALAINRS